MSFRYETDRKARSTADLRARSAVGLHLLVGRQA
jgi:hypothetical protein